MYTTREAGDYINVRLYGTDVQRVKLCIVSSVKHDRHLLQVETQYNSASRPRYEWCYCHKSATRVTKKISAIGKYLGLMESHIVESRDER